MAFCWRFRRPLRRGAGAVPQPGPVATISRQFARLDGDGLARQGTRFVLAGGTASAVNWLVRLGASFVVPFPAALVIGAVVGMIVGFVLYRAWVFPRSTRRLHEQTVLFIAVNAVTAGFVICVSLFAAAMLTGLPVSTRIQESVAHAIGIALGSVISFVGHRTFTFARRQND